MVETRRAEMKRTKHMSFNFEVTPEMFEAIENKMREEMYPSKSELMRGLLRRWLKEASG